MWLGEPSANSVGAKDNETLSIAVWKQEDNIEKILKISQLADLIKGEEIAGNEIQYKQDAAIFVNANIENANYVPDYNDNKELIISPNPLKDETTIKFNNANRRYGVYHYHQFNWRRKLGDSRRIKQRLKLTSMP